MRPRSRSQAHIRDQEPSRTSWHLLTAHLIKQLLGNNKPHAIGRVAMTGILPVVHKVITVIEGDLFAGTNEPPGNNPNLPLLELSVAIRGTTMVQQARRIPRHIPIEICAFVEGENKFIALLTTPERFLFANRFAQVLDNFHSTGNVSPGKPAKAVNRRMPEAEPFRLGMDSLDLLFGIHACIVVQNSVMSNRFPRSTAGTAQCGIFAVSTELNV